MNKEQTRQLALAGTITFPATFPKLAEIELRQSKPASGEGPQQLFLVAVEQTSPRITIRRVLKITDVAAVFIPFQRNSVDFRDGDWLLGEEIPTAIRLFLKRGTPLEGIVYAPEQAPSLLEVSAGMTAAESSQYYPPLPSDRSVNHYDPYRETRASREPMTAQHEPRSYSESVAAGHPINPQESQGLGAFPCEYVAAESGPAMAASGKPYREIHAAYPTPCE